MYTFKAKWRWKCKIYKTIFFSKGLNEKFGNDFDVPFVTIVKDITMNNILVYAACKQLYAKLVDNKSVSLYGHLKGDKCMTET